VANFTTDSIFSESITRTGVMAELSPGFLWMRPSISADFGVPDAGARILETLSTYQAGVVTITTRLSRSAKIVTWVRDNASGVLLIEPSISPEALQNHSIILTLGKGSSARTVKIFQEVSNG
jgi:hypothetical protein